MRLTTILGLGVLLLGGMLQAQSNVESVTPAPAPGAGGTVLAGPIVNPGNGHVYYLLNPDTWTNCEATAVKLGGHLATVRDPQEQAWMVAAFGPEKDFSEHSFWIGLSQDDGGKYVWASGEACAYRRWGAYEPNSSGSKDGKYVFIGRYADGTWNDTNNQNLGANDGTPWSYFGPLPRGLVEVVPAVGPAPKAGGADGANGS